MENPSGTHRGRGGGERGQGGRSREERGEGERGQGRRGQGGRGRGERGQGGRSREERGEGERGQGRRGQGGRGRGGRGRRERSQGGRDVRGRGEEGIGEGGRGRRERSQGGRDVRGRGGEERGQGGRGVRRNNVIFDGGNHGGNHLSNCSQEPHEATFGNSFPYPPPLVPPLKLNFPGNHQVNTDYQNRYSGSENYRQTQFSDFRGDTPHFQPQIPPSNVGGVYLPSLNNRQSENEIFFQPHGISPNTSRPGNKEYPKKNEKEPRHSFQKNPKSLTKDRNLAFQFNSDCNNARSIYIQPSSLSLSNYQPVERSSDNTSFNTDHQKHRKDINQYSTFDQHWSGSSGQNSNDFSSGNQEHNPLQYRTPSSKSSSNIPNYRVRYSNEKPNYRESKQSFKQKNQTSRNGARSRSNSFNTEGMIQTSKTCNYFEGKTDETIWSSTSSLNSTNSLQEHKTMQNQNHNFFQKSHDDVNSHFNLDTQDQTSSKNKDVNFQRNNDQSFVLGVDDEDHANQKEKFIERKELGLKKTNQSNHTSGTDFNTSNCDDRNVITINKLDNVLGMEPLDIVQLLNADEYSEIFKEDLSPRMLISVIAILRKVCSCDSSNLKGEILQKASLPVFLDQIFAFLTKLPYTADQSLLDSIQPFYSNVITMYSTLSDFMPSAEKMWFTHLRELKKSIKLAEKHLNLQPDCNVLSTVNFLLEGMETSNESRENIKKDQKQEGKKFVHSYFPEPIGDFRTVSLFPRPEDIYSEQPFLYPNVVNGPYRSVDQYLDTQFKLLREDFISPIRQAIRDYKKQQHSKEKKRIDNVRIYRKVKFLHPKTITDKVGYELCFDVDNKINRVNWEYSNRFMFGSLLLFTNDHFDTFFLATVANRNVKELESKRVIVELRGPTFNEKSILGREFVMAESEAYFEPYFNVLNALQRFDQRNFPLARYIVDVVNETQPPNYLSQEDVYNICMENNNFSFRVLNDNEWPTNHDLGLDSSQYNAYKAALTNDIIVVQGPPGTGKTFLGLRIAQSLLKNSEVWNRTSSPILVVCYTNHALDQFLEGLLPFTSKLVRIGGKSKGAELDKYNIRDRRKEQNYYNKANFQQTRALKLEMSTIFSEIKTHQINIQSLDDSGGILALKTLQLVMSDHQRMFFINDDHLIDWLLVGIGSVSTNEVRVKISVTADRGVVAETSVHNDITNDEDDRLKQAFFDFIELESVPPSEETVVVHYACRLNAIQSKHKDMSKGNGRWNRETTCDNLGLILAHLSKELIECKKLAHSDEEKKYLMEFIQLNALQPSCRWKLYHTWVENLKNGLIMELNKKNMAFKDLAFRFEQLRQGDDLQILKTSHVVGTTTTIAAKLQPLLTALAPKIVIVEEAAEVLEAHIIASLTSSCEHLILIGDHKQLRPSVAETRMARQYQLDVSLFERMVENGMACHTLTLQHRMRPEISKQLVPTIYPILEDHVSVQGRENVKGMDKNVFFMTHSNFEDEVTEITSKRNIFEADILLKLARYLILQGYNPSEITILATYKGQMYHMKNEIKKIDGFPRGIQITCVDNFQGEENKIILLSLVRSNAINKIGFLEIENRVCVALSRARDGLYIVGNMDNLVASSKIWPQIKNSLVQQQSFGTSLVLRCQNHPNQTTHISSGKEFSKVSEGGCSLVCDQPLPCGHLCKSMCHVSKDYHQKYRCKQPCSRIPCNEGHQCPERCCVKPCSPCKVPMNRGLPCGHTADVPCYWDIGRFKCKEPVEVVVKDCMHSITVPCHSKADPKCNIPCIVRLECGHTCEQLCHVNNDPDHLQFVCRKPCPRLNKDCSEEHNCKLQCCDACQPCVERVEKQLPCGHIAPRTLCSSNPLSVKCYKPCERTQACAHPCNKLCWDSCGPCLLIVEKKVESCGHTVKIPCSQEPTKLLCGGRCKVKMACGHQCTKLCRDFCSTRDCEHPKNFKITTLLCGHTNAKIPCNKVDKVDTMTVEELMQFCSEPCGQMLTCNHPCSGSCNECMQGRIHKVCDQPCNNVLICGHSCQVPCREVCPPCNKTCLHSCKHSKCPKKCGEVCSPCNEPCEYACEHLKCTKRCMELCDREPCYEDCNKELACSHPCVGYCGEPCPPCPQCNPQNFEVFFGTEDEEDAKWIYLEDCNHTFESSGLEYWLNMQQDSKEIISKVCPSCKTPIVTTQRFMNLIKATYKDVQKIKSQCYGKHEVIKKQRLQSLRKLQQLDFVEMPPPENEPDELMNLYNKLIRDLPEEKYKGKVNKRNAIGAQKVCLLCFSTEFYVSLYERKKETWLNLNEASKILVTKKINFLTVLLMERKLKISEQEMKSFECELKRIHRLFDLLIYSSSPEYHITLSISTEAAKVNDEAMKLISYVAAYDNLMDKKIKDLLLKLKDLIKSSTYVSDAERAMINKAMGSEFHSSQKTGHWFKCKKGHIYCITECGGAMEEAKCPVAGCGERIGGQNHALRADQAIASEMDGARHAAWSEQNNLENFGFQIG